MSQVLHFGFEAAPKKEIIEHVKGVSSIGQAATAVIGIFVLFFYCVSKRILPDGLSLGDLFSLVWIAMGFGLLMILGTAYGVTIALLPLKCLINVANRHNSKKPPHEIHPFFRGRGWVLVSLFVILTFFVAIAGSWEKRAMDARLKTIGFFLSYGFLLFSVFGVRYAGQRQLHSILAAAMLIVVTFIASYLFTKPPLLDLTMGVVGIRSGPGGLIVVSNADQERLSELAQQSGLTIDFCQLPRSSRWATLDARVLWHNIGSTSYIELVDRETAGEKSLLVPIPRGNLELIRTEQISLTCKDGLGYKRPS